MNDPGKPPLAPDLCKLLVSRVEENRCRRDNHRVHFFRERDFARLQIA